VTSPTGRSNDRPAARAQRWLRRLTSAVTATTAGGVLLAGSPVTSAGPATDEPVLDTSEAALSLAAADSHRWPGHPGRKVIHYRVRPGDTATGLAVRFHAWTDELRAINHLSRHATLYVGERIRIPVVLAALRKHRHASKHPHRRTHHHTRARHPKVRHTAPRTHARAARPWALADVSRNKVRRVVVRTSQKHGVDPELALAVAWQESGWQQRRISSAGAIGAMQVLPGTAQWMSLYAGRPLNPYGLYDNVTAGVVLLKVLRSQTGPRKTVAAYYQGLGAVQKHGMYPSTKAYVKNVVYLRKLLERGWNPA
jgi:LysM repeat protein